MDELLLRRLAGAGVLLAVIFIISLLLPAPRAPGTPEDGMKLVEVAVNDPRPIAPLTPDSASAAPENPGAETRSDAAPESAAVTAPPAPEIDPAPGEAARVIEAPARNAELPPDSPSAEEEVESQPSYPNPVRTLPVPRLDARPAPKPAPKPSAKPETAAAPTKPEPPAKPKTEATKPAKSEAPATAKPKPAAPAKTTPPATARNAQPATTPKPSSATAKPATAPTTAATPPAKPPASATTGGGWMVQAGTYADIANARRVQGQLQAAGVSSQIVTAKTVDGLRYRVRSGPYTSRESADRIRQRITATKTPASLVPPNVD